MLSKMKKNIIKIILGTLIIIGSIILALLNQFSYKGIRITQWDNLYEENNIIFFYDVPENSKISFLNSNFHIMDIIKEQEDDVGKVLKICDLVAKTVDYDDIADVDADNGYDILGIKEKNNSKKVSRRDFCIITRDMLSSAGIKSRVGYFRNGNSQFKEKSQYYILEFWSNEASKWIAIDCVDKGYFMDGNRRLSALDILDVGIRKAAYLGNTSQKDYKNKIKKYLDSYTIDIDNTVDKVKSNSQVCYLNNDNALEIKRCNQYAPPTIFTQHSNLFERSPLENSVIKDKKAYIIISLFDIKNKENESNETQAIIAGFKDGSVMPEYYLNINNGGYKKINNYEQIKLEKGVTQIKLSIDGENDSSSITINKEK